MEWGGGGGVLTASSDVAHILITIFPGEAGVFYTVTRTFVTSGTEVHTFLSAVFCFDPIHLNVFQ